MQEGRAALVCTLGVLLTAVVLAAGAGVCQTHVLNDSSAAPPSGARRANPQISEPASAAALPPTPVTTAVAGTAAFQGLTVRDIQFHGFSDDAHELERLRQMVAQKANEPLDRRKIRQSVQTLYATGRFADLQVEAERAPGNQVTLVFNAKENLFIGVVTVVGAPKRPTANQLVNASKLEMGQQFAREKVDRAIENMKRVMEDNGFYGSSFRESEQVKAQNQQIDIEFRVTPGERARVGNVTVTGDPGYRIEEIRDIADLGAGHTLTGDRISKALQKLRKKYQKSGRLEAQVAITNRVYRAETNTVDYMLRVDRGPRVDIRVEGASLRKGLLKKYVPVYEENAVDDDLLNEGQRNLRDYYQTKGYFDVEVAVKEDYDPDKNHLHVIYQVERSERHKLVAVALEGNQYFDHETIRERMQVQPAGLVLIQGRFSQNLLSRDVESVKNLYRANGFEQVKVTAEVQDDYQGKRGQMRVVLHIEEGPQTRVASLHIVGNAHVTEDTIRGLINTVEGQAYSEFNVAGDRDSVLSYYFNRGFPDVTFEASTKPLPGEATRMDVTYSIKEGEQVFVDRVLLSGLHYTRDYIARREFRIHDGDPLSQVDMLETQRKLYDLGLFNEVNMAVQNPEGEAKYKNLLFNVKEAKRWTFNYGLGFEFQSGSQPVDLTQLSKQQGVQVPSTPTTIRPIPPQGRTGFSPRVSFDVTRINFRGRDHTIVFKTRFGRLQQRALLSYDAPRWFDRPNLRLTFNAFFDTSRDVRTFTSERLEGSLSAEQVFSRVTTVLYRFSYRRVKVDPNTLVIDPNLIPLFSKPVRVGMPSLTYIRDKRDDPIETRKGNYTTFDTGVASGAFGSEAAFGRFLIQNSTYQAFGRRKGWVFARSTRIGVEEPFGTGPVIPLPERFFSGGPNSHRGFALNQAGPRDLQTGFPVGGNALFVNNLELRFPPMLLPFVKDNLSFVMFHDAGNVFDSGQDMVRALLRWRQRGKSNCESLANVPCDFNYFSHAMGTGIRYRTPIGPVRFDVSYNLNPLTFPVRGGTLPHFETLKRINYFFSIGQTF